MTPKLVIFDCDGVLVDSEPVTIGKLAANLTRHGFPLTAQECGDMFIGGTIAGVADIVRSKGIALPETWVADIYSEIYAELRKGTPIIPGVKDVLDQLDAVGIPYCVASNGSDEKMDITLTQTGLAARFENRRFSAHRLKVAKPDPRLFLTAVEAFDLAPVDCVVIEDSATGAKGAARAGIRCFGYAPEGDGAKLTAEGATLFRDMGDLPNLLSLPAKAGS